MNIKGDVMGGAHSRSSPLFPGKAVSFLSFRASLPELSKPGSTVETVQKLFMVAGDRLGPRGEGIRV